MAHTESEVDTMTLPETPTAGDNRQWLIMLYLAGDDAKGDNNMSEAITKLVHKLKNPKYLPDNRNMHLVILADGLIEEGKPVTQIYYQQGTQLREVTEMALSCEDWMSPKEGPEGARQVNTGDDKTLESFILWACSTYSATYTMLALVNHGGGWGFDTGNPGQPNGNPNTSPWRGGICVDLRVPEQKSWLSTKRTSEVMKTVAETRRKPKPINVLFFDACLMGMIECAYEVWDYVDYVVAGENLLWAELPYEQYLNSQVLKEDTTPYQLARGLVERYNIGGSPVPFTIATLDTSLLPDLGSLVNQLAQQLLDGIDDDRRSNIRAAYRRSQMFDYNNDWLISSDEACVDLLDFAQKLREQAGIPESVKEIAGKVIAKIGTNHRVCETIDRIHEPATPPAQIPPGVLGDSQVVIAIRARSGGVTKGNEPIEWDLSNAYGLSIYLPAGMRDFRLKDRKDYSEKTQLPLQLDCYSQPWQLRFTAEVGKWAELLRDIDHYIARTEDERGLLPNCVFSNFNLPHLLRVRKPSGAKPPSVV